MRDEHIIKFLEERSPGHLSVSEIEAIRAHTARCAECLRAYEAASASSLLLRERASVSVEPPPFFHTRVMAAIRERNLSAEPFGLQKLWLAARAIVISLALLVAMLVTGTILMGGIEPELKTSGFSDDAAEIVIFEQDGAVYDEMTYGQALTNIYAPATDEGGGNGNRQ
jgi:anti-sigma factor RsiW